MANWQTRRDGNLAMAQNFGSKGIAKLAAFSTGRSINFEPPPFRHDETSTWNDLGLAHWLEFRCPTQMLPVLQCLSDVRVVPISYKAVVSPFVLVDTLNANLPGMHPNEFGTCDFRSSDSAKSMRKNVLHFFFSTWHQWTCSTSVTLLPRNHSNPNAQQYFCFQISSIAICFPHMWIGEWNLALAGSGQA